MQSTFRTPNSNTGEMYEIRLHDDALFDLCQDQITAYVLLRHLSDEGLYDNVTCFAFEDIVYQLANAPKNHPTTKPDLLKT